MKPASTTIVAPTTKAPPSQAVNDPDIDRVGSSYTATSSAACAAISIDNQDRCVSAADGNAHAGYHGNTYAPARR